MGVARLQGTCSMYEMAHFFGYVTETSIKEAVAAAIKHYYQTFNADSREDPPAIIYNHSPQVGPLQVWLDCGFIPMYTYTSPHPGNVTVTHLVYGKVTKWGETEVAKIDALPAEYEEERE